MSAQSNEQSAETVRRCCTCGRATDRTLNERKKFKVELRPYGPGGADICFECATATPEADRQTAQAFGALLDANAAISPTGGVLLTEDGLAPLDEATAVQVEALLTDGTSE